MCANTAKPRNITIMYKATPIEFSVSQIRRSCFNQTGKIILLPQTAHCIPCQCALISVYRIHLSNPGCRQDFGKGVLYYQRQCWRCLVMSQWSQLVITFVTSKRRQLMIVKQTSLYRQNPHDIEPQLLHRCLLLCSAGKVSDLHFTVWEFAADCLGCRFDIVYTLIYQP